MREKLPFIPEELKVLIVDEHDLIRKTISKCVQNLGVEEVVSVNSVKDAKRQIANIHFDLVFCELFFKEGDGFSLIDMIRSKDHRSDSPIIILTGQADRDDIVKAVDKGATDYLLKPFQAPDLEKKVIKVLTIFHSPGKTIQMLRSAERLITESKFQDADMLLDMVQKKMPDNPLPRYLRALILLRDGKEEFAIEALRKGVAQFPEFLKNYKLLSDIYLRRKDVGMAIEALSNELEINPKHAIRQIKLANLLIKSKEYLRAIFHLRQALLENNKSAEALYGMGIAYAKDENLEKSIYYFKRYRRVFPTDSKPLEAIIQICREVDQERLAELALRDEKKQHPERLDTYFILAKFLMSQEDRVEDAIQCLRDGIVRHPTEKALYMGLAKLYLSEGDDKKVMEVFDEYRRNTGDPESFTIQSDLFLKNNKFAQAIATIHSGLGEGFSSPGFLKTLLMASYKTKQYGKNYFILLRMIRMAPTDSPALKGKLPEVRKLVEARRTQRQRKSSNQAS